MPASLRSLSDKDLLSRIQAATRDERESTLVVLLLLAEMDRRDLHLKLGYPSLFEYCTSALGYSKSAAGRRIQTARCMTRFAGLYEMLERNEVNLSTVSQVSRALNEENYRQLLARIRGKSQDEVQAILAEYQPCAVPRDRVRTVVVHVPLKSSETAAALVSSDCKATLAAKQDCEKSAYSRSGSELSPIQPAAPTPATATVQVEKRVMLQFAVRPEFMAKLNKIKSLAWHRLPVNASLEQVFELAMDLMLEKEDPAKRVERREQRSQRNVSRTASKSARYVPAPIRDQVFRRDNGQCAFVAPGGRRCGSTQALQIDHMKPVARGGASTADNLRLLCAYHNRLEAERLLGRWESPRQERAGMDA